MDNVELSEHDKAMIAVADNGDPNDPAENKDDVVTLPSDEKPESDDKKDEAKPEETEGESEDKPEDKPEDDKESIDEDDTELTEEQKELNALRQEKKERAIYEAVGGQEEYTKLTQWARDNLSKDQIDVYNQAINQGDSGTALFAAQALQAMNKLASYENHGYQGDVTVPGGDQSATSSQGYESQAQMTADMSDPRYASDPAFRAKVEQKLAATSPGLF